MKTIILISVVLLACTMIAGQSMQPDLVPMHKPMAMDSLNNRFNFYDFAGNPAALYEDESARLLRVGQNTFYNSGDYHYPLTPESRNDQHYFALTVMPLSENDIFKGYFAYHRQMDEDVQWSHQSRFQEVNPFILGDSSTGDFELNGLYWAGEWAHRFGNKWLAGAAFYYNVDQRLKDVFPKPLNKHRDISARLGVHYRLGMWNAGLMYRYSDEQEKVEVSKYSLDQNLTPVFYKFRYSDLPVILRGKTSEERQIDYASHTFSAQLSGVLNRLNVMASLSYAFDEGQVYDGGSRREDQGRFESSNAAMKIWLAYHLQKYQLYAMYQLNRIDRQAYHPDFGFTIAEQPRTDHDLTLGLAIRPTHPVSVFTEASLSLQEQQYEDRITYNWWQYRQSGFGLRAGLNVRINTVWEYALWLHMSRFAYSDVVRTDQQYSLYFNTLYNQRLDYFTDLQSVNGVGMQLTFHYRPVLDISLSASYGYYDAGNRSREDVRLALWSKLYIF